MPVALISASTCGSISLRVRWRRGDGDRLGQAFALRRVEDGEALQERDRLGFVAGLARALLLVVRDEAIGIDDRRAALALADIAAERQSLAEGEPALARKAVLDHRPQRISTLMPE